MFESKLKFSDEFQQAALEEMKNMMSFAEKQGVFIEAYISLCHRIKAKSARVKQEQAEMEDMLKEFEKEHQAGGRPVFI